MTLTSEQRQSVNYWSLIFFFYCCKKNWGVKNDVLMLKESFNFSRYNSNNPKVATFDLILNKITLLKGTNRFVALYSIIRSRKEMICQSAMAFSTLLQGITIQAEILKDRQKKDERKKVVLKVASLSSSSSSLSSSLGKVTL